MKAKYSDVVFEARPWVEVYGLGRGSYVLGLNVTGLGLDLGLEICSDQFGITLKL